MIYLKNLLFQDKFHSKWLIFIIDLLIVISSLFISFFIKDGLRFNETNNYYIILYSCIAALSFFSMRIHTRIIRYSNTKDMQRVITAVLVTNLAFLIVLYSIINPYLQLNLNNHKDVFLVNIFISSIVLIGFRILIKDLFHFITYQTATTKKENVLIYGSNTSSILIKNTVETQEGTKMQVQGFIDTAADKLYKCIEQKIVYPDIAIDRLYKKFAIKTLFITSEHLKASGNKRAIEKCISLGIRVITVPPTNQWINGQPSINQFKDLKIEDLLERDPIKLCKDHILKDLTGKRVLVTGAAGSIGAEIVRQVLSFNPELVVLCDQAETPLHNIQLEIEDSNNKSRVHLFIADIQNSNRIKMLFNQYKPQVVFHAAAYKHVPMMESNPTEAVLTNILGTKSMADISLEYNVEKFIMISTDKAVRPTNIMGASKRIAEMYIQSLNNAVINDNSTQQTKFITTRFGNVLGSNGSVIPRFKMQIERGGPVTVTHPEIARYFMTIPESVQLVLEAAVMGTGGEIFLFDMGKPIKIKDLALNMIKLAGFKPGEDIKIVYTGLRPGEKLYEELLNKEEEIIPTYNDKIKISKTISHNYNNINENVNMLLAFNLINNVDEMVSLMKKMIPDFISKNSCFEKLDAKFQKTEIVNS
ncbi:MAG: NDP-sugar epimerase [Mucilaginibacter sp.]|nr:NDP-sugar epimerase [Mucilaginibacter sp.]